MLTLYKVFNRQTHKEVGLFTSKEVAKEVALANIGSRYYPEEVFETLEEYIEWVQEKTLKDAKRKLNDLEYKLLVEDARRGGTWP